MSLSERIHDLNREIGDTVERAIAELRQEITQRLRLSNEEMQRRLADLTPALPPAFLSDEEFAKTERELGLKARRDAQRDLRDGFAAIDRARSQAEILTALLHESARYASRAAVLLVRGGEVRGWGSAGFGDAEPSVRKLVLRLQDGPWGRLIQGQGAVRLAAGDCAELCSRIESPLPRDGVAVPLLLRDRVAAALYADRMDGGELGIEALQILAHAAAQAIETLPFRERAATATLSLTEEEPAAVQAPAPPPREPESAPAPAAAAAETPVEAEPAVAAEPEPAVSAPEPLAAAGAPWTAEDELSAVQAETEEAPAEPEIPAPRYTAELPVTSAAETAAIAAAPAGEKKPEAVEPTPGAMEEAVPRYPRSVETKPTAPVPFPEANPQATVLLERPAAEPAEPAPPAPSPPPLRPVPVAGEAAAVSPGERPAPLISGTPEVRPPSDIEGPGWAFSTTRVPVASPFGNEAQLEEARRLARLLVSEIKLYNEEQVEEGRRNRDIYERLKEDIDRSRQMYDERVDPQILRSTDYFYQELVRILAAGDSKALGI
jgi:hypothetical protein